MNAHQILHEHARDVAQTVSCNMSKEESQALRCRLKQRITLLETVDAHIAGVLRRGLNCKFFRSNGSKRVLVGFVAVGGALVVNLSIMFMAILILFKQRVVL